MVNESTHLTVELGSKQNFETVGVVVFVDKIIKLVFENRNKAMDKILKLVFKNNQCWKCKRATPHRIRGFCIKCKRRDIEIYIEVLLDRHGVPTEQQAAYVEEIKKRMNDPK